MTLDELFPSGCGGPAGNLVLCNGKPVAFFATGMNFKPFIRDLEEQARLIGAPAEFKIRRYLKHPEGRPVVRTFGYDTTNRMLTRIDESP